MNEIFKSALRDNIKRKGVFWMFIMSAGVVFCSACASGLVFRLSSVTMAAFMFKINDSLNVDIFFLAEQVNL